MDACLPYMAAGAAIVGAMWYTQQMSPPHGRFSDATACSARRAAVSARTAAAADAPAEGSWEDSFQSSGVVDETVEQQFAGVRPATNAPPSVDAVGVRSQLTETDVPLGGKTRGLGVLTPGVAGMSSAKPVPESLQDKMFNAPEA